jgi:hypothetical protein
MDQAVEEAKKLARISPVKYSIPGQNCRTVPVLLDNIATPDYPTLKTTVPEPLETTSVPDL